MKSSKIVRALLTFRYSMRPSPQIRLWPRHVCARRVGRYLLYGGHARRDGRVALVGNAVAVPTTARRHPLAGRAPPSIRVSAALTSNRPEACGACWTRAGRACPSNKCRAVRHTVERREHSTRPPVTRSRP